MMIPRRIRGATHRWGAPDSMPDCVTVSARQEEHDGRAVFALAYEPNPEQLAALNAGGSIILRLWGTVVPHALNVEEPPKEDEQ